MWRREDLLAGASFSSFREQLTVVLAFGAGYLMTRQNTETGERGSHQTSEGDSIEPVCVMCKYWWSCVFTCAVLMLLEDGFNVHCTGIVLTSSHRNIITQDYRLTPSPMTVYNYAALT